MSYKDGGSQISRNYQKHTDKRRAEGVGGEYVFKISDYLPASNKARQGLTVLYSYGYAFICLKIYKIRN